MSHDGLSPSGAGLGPPSPPLTPRGREEDPHSKEDRRRGAVVPVVAPAPAPPLSLGRGEDEDEGIAPERPEEEVPRRGVPQPQQQRQRGYALSPSSSIPPCRRRRRPDPPSQNRLTNHAQHLHLNVQWGSSLHSVHPFPILSNHVVVVPGLFGSHLNVTTFEELAEEWGGRMGPPHSTTHRHRPRFFVPEEQEVGGTESQQHPMTNSVVHRVGRYFSINVRHADVHVSIQNGRTKKFQTQCAHPPEAHENDCFVVATFGAPRNLVLHERRGRGDDDDNDIMNNSTTTNCSLQMVNNTAVALMRDVSVQGWRYGIGTAAAAVATTTMTGPHPHGGGHRDCTTTTTIVVTLYGRRCCPSNDFVVGARGASSTDLPPTQPQPPPIGAPAADVPPVDAGRRSSISSSAVEAALEPLRDVASKEEEDGVNDESARSTSVDESHLRRRLSKEERRQAKEERRQAKEDRRCAREDRRRDREERRRCRRSLTVSRRRSLDMDDSRRDGDRDDEDENLRRDRRDRRRSRRRPTDSETTSSDSRSRSRSPSSRSSSSTASETPGGRPRTRRRLNDDDERHPRVSESG